MEITKELIIAYVEKAKKGKQGAFSFLLHQYWNEVYGFQLKRVRNEYEAEDITIETFSKAFDKIDTFDSKYTFSTWLITISKNIQIDKYRKKSTSVIANTTDTSDERIKKIVDDSPTPEDILISEQNLAELLRFIKKLKPHYQDVINLRYFQEMSYNEISENLGEPLNNVKVRLLRARKLLAEIINKNNTI
ncbi:sigma-70 family RNA polymerase sigma factor [Rasiella rasia]|uniref:Sigma-70 family RNA polymerase sigma factor n=1 Tax=Rasiella rasia TaxID=2744027 RepID=A0A6G6GPM1_9FLAO|nr:sigma-70 family RNA polymerase sigma factor [Rasiella rasia]QIE60487.1 sigma-70 family RNA polymerase sigma factor [Rasiella rasia]